MALAFFRRNFHSGRMAWLVALALWLPVAQWAVAAHGLRHLDAAQAEHRDGQPSLPLACGTCVAAATIGGAAPLSAVAAGTAPAAPQAQPQSVEGPAAAAAPLPAYRSRAPPLLTT